MAAHRNVAIYHDGLRTSVLELESGERTRPDLAAYAYRISIGFVVAYALPFALASGILTIHMILLGTDVVGVRCRTLVAAAGGGLAWGLAVVAGVDLFVHGVARLPVATTGRELLWLPLVYSLPLLGVVAAAELHGFRGGVVAAAATLAVWAVAHAVLRAAFPASATVFGSGLVALAVVVVALAVLALRERAEDAADLAFFEENIRRARRGWPYLLPIAALIAVTASSGWIAGEPVQLALLSSNHLEGAAVVAVFSAIGFLPLQGMTGLVSGVWNQDGYPDWLLGAGYVISNPVLAGAAGAGLMAVELGTLRPVARLLDDPARHHLARQRGARCARRRPGARDARGRRPRRDRRRRPGRGVRRDRRLRAERRARPAGDAARGAGLRLRRRARRDRHRPRARPVHVTTTTKATAMRERPLGRSGLTVSELSLGTWAFGGDEWGPPRDAEAIATIRAAVDAGVTLVDTADVYGYGHARTSCGARSPARRRRCSSAARPATTSSTRRGRPAAARSASTRATCAVRSRER